MDQMLVAYQEWQTVILKRPKIMERSFLVTTAVAGIVNMT